MHRSGVLEVPAEGTGSANCPSLSPRVHTPLDEFSRRSVGGVDFVVIWPYIVDPILFHVSAPFADATVTPTARLTRAECCLRSPAHRAWQDCG